MLGSLSTAREIHSHPFPRAAVVGSEQSLPSPCCAACKARGSRVSKVLREETHSCKAGPKMKGFYSIQMLPTAIYTPSSKAIYTLPCFCAAGWRISLHSVFLAAWDVLQPSPDCKDRLFPASFLEEEGNPWAAATGTALKAGLASWLPV